MPGDWSEKTDARIEKDPARDRQLAKKHLERAYRQAKRSNEPHPEEKKPS